MSGSTSVAAPMMAGVFGLIWSVLRYLSRCCGETGMRLLIKLRAQRDGLAMWQVQYVAAVQGSGSFHSTGTACINCADGWYHAVFPTCTYLFQSRTISPVPSGKPHQTPVIDPNAPNPSGGDITDPNISGTPQLPSIDSSTVDNQADSLESL